MEYINKMQNAKQSFEPCQIRHFKIYAH